MLSTYIYILYIIFFRLQLAFTDPGIQDKRYQVVFLLLSEANCFFRLNHSFLNKTLFLAWRALPRLCITYTPEKPLTQQKAIVNLKDQPYKFRNRLSHKMGISNVCYAIFQPKCSTCITEKVDCISC